MFDELAQVDTNVHGEGKRQKAKLVSTNDQ